MSEAKGPLIEKLAAIEHARWSRWHVHCKKNWTPENVSRWDRQARTSYEDLSETEKESDRREVREYFDIAYSAGRASRDGLRKALEEMLDTKYIGMTDNVWLVGKRALEADGVYK